ncbi:MAG TPA: methylated-DNA--[protein]-cysteine S-methyltransferase [Bryobacteraceae bacterium]|nr:methylated-DNA--[protein]-cysteine S-methyltransferase [Bryobacteraceae bacterium]
MLLHHEETSSPLGRILFFSDGQAVCALEFAGHEQQMRAALERRFGPFDMRRRSDPLNLAAQLREYFAGDLRVFDATPVNAGGTPFQQRVWRALRAIPAGTTCSYGELAARLGNPAACRAVGRANALNPVSIIVPCHRVIGASSSLTGYGGGLERKQWLLRHEGAMAGNQLRLAAEA